MQHSDRTDKMTSRAKDVNKALNPPCIGSKNHTIKGFVALCKTMKGRQRSKQTWDPCEFTVTLCCDPNHEGVKLKTGGHTQP